MGIISDFEDGEIKEEDTLAYKINNARGRLFTSLKELAEYLDVPADYTHSHATREYSNTDFQQGPGNSIWQFIPREDNHEIIGGAYRIAYICNTCDGIRVGSPLQPANGSPSSWDDHTCKACDEVIGAFANKKYGKYAYKWDPPF